MPVGISKIKQRVESALEEDKRTRDFAIEVIDENGMVTLQGKVPSQEAKEAAEEIASNQQGVIDVTNALVVDSEKDKSPRVQVGAPTKVPGNNPTQLYPMVRNVENLEEEEKK